MSVEKARAHYTGTSGHRKLNCAQAVVSAFKEKFDMSEDMIERFSAYGGGRAPDGQCGSLYAARVMLEKSYPTRIKDCEDVLLSSAGSLKCREIRAGRKLSCVGCVETVAASIARI
ncbi:MAG: C-GCAxxG-C-C family protein [Candidatus Omnitrophica bacterium]|nr:C-GCAxxG-C-C family protein [Candidatus Omnitrophota bacterium]